MSIKIIICDDNEQDRKIEKEKTKQLLDLLYIDFEITEYKDGKKLFDDIDKISLYDILILDIDMPGITGIDIAKEIMDKAPLVNVIFVTNRADLVFEAIHCRPFRFVRKEKLNEELEEAIQASLTKIKNESVIYEFKTTQENVRIPVKDIIYLESRSHYLHLHLINGEQIIRGKISEYEEKLKGHGFIRIHMGYLVNVRNIYSVTSKEVTLDDGTILPVSRKKSVAVKDVHASYVRRFVRGVY